MNHQQKIYQERLDANNAQANKLQKSLNVFSTLRVAIFLITLTTIIYFANERNDWGIGITLPIGTILFFWAFNRFVQISQKLKYHQILATINQEELLRIGGKFQDADKGGDEFKDYKHPYINDLDIFGATSIFLLINRTASWRGKQMLANWLKKKATKSEILERQGAVKELVPMLDWRQQFRASGMLNESKNADLRGTISWLNTIDQSILKKHILLLSKLLPALAVGLLLLYFLVDLPLGFVLLGMLGNFWLLQQTAKSISKAVEMTDNSVAALKGYARQMADFEKPSFQHAKLNTLQSALTQDSSGGAKALAELGRILYNLEMRKNAYFYVLVNVFVLYDVQWMIKLEQWKIKYAPYLDTWLTAIAEVEALQSLAGFTSLHEEFTFPEFVEGELLIDAKTLGHPLIDAEIRVCNDLAFGGKGKTAIITGSNMSGKSTFERTLGVNMVLAYAGAPVCAKHFRLSLVQVFTSMRVQDSLEENVSGFYAELRRLQQLLELLNQENQDGVFYLLDEVLKGTNSQDRHNGAKAIIKQLAQKNAFGLISTHDLELGELENDYPDLVVNYSFNSQVENGKLKFDHKITRGVCHSFSATKLMQGIGIVIED